MMTRSVSGVFLACWVDFRNLTQLQATVLAGFRAPVSGVSGLSRMQACTHTISTALIHLSNCFLMREKQPNTPDTPDTVNLKLCFIRVFGVLGLCRVEGFLCRVRFFRGKGR